MAVRRPQMVHCL